MSEIKKIGTFVSISSLAGKYATQKLKKKFAVLVLVLV